MSGDDLRRQLQHVHAAFIRHSARLLDTAGSFHSRPRRSKRATKSPLKSGLPPCPQTARSARENRVYCAPCPVFRPPRNASAGTVSQSEVKTSGTPPRGEHSAPVSSAHVH